jgi:hypothetical protein
LTLPVVFHRIACAVKGRSGVIREDRFGYPMQRLHT